MALARQLLRPVARLAGMHAGRQVRQFLEAHQHTGRVQDAVLQELLATHARTDFGREHGFDRIRSYEDFIKAVPLGDYETLRPYMQKVYEGRTEALLPPGERVLMFSQTSGTTGKPKHIPVTPRFLRQMRRGWNIFGVRMLMDHSDGWLRQILQISSPMQESLSPCKIPCGAISGLIAASQKRIVRMMYAVRPGVSSISDPVSRYYTTLRCGVGKDVGIITTANPSSIIKLMEVGQAHSERLIRDVADGTTQPPGDLPEELSRSLRFPPNRQLARQMARGIETDGQLLPKHFWNLAFLTHWTGGTLKLYLPRLRELFGDVPIRDIGLLASEGRFSIPIRNNTPEGIAEITGNFLEFIPAKERDATNPSVLRAEQLEVGEEYFLVVTNWAGLWRYNIDDRVRVTGRFGQSPVFEFLSRGSHTANITGEKITEHQVVEAMGQALRQVGAQCERFVVQGRFAHQPYYELRLEAIDGLDPDSLAGCLDDCLGKLNLEYQSKRKSGRLGPIQAVRLAPGTLNRTEAECIHRRRGRSEQYKHQYLLTEVLADQ